MSVVSCAQREITKGHLSVHHMYNHDCSLLVTYFVSFYCFNYIAAVIKSNHVFQLKSCLFSKIKKNWQ